MDEKSLPDIFSQLLPDDLEKALGLEQDSSDEQNNILVASLKAAAGQSGGLVESAVSQFLNGEGDLHSATRTAITRSRSTAESEVAACLTTQFKLAPFTARMVAMLLVKLFPSIGKLTGAAAPAARKPRRKKKATASSKKNPAASSKKKPAKTKPARKPAAKPAVKKKPAAKGSKKEAAAKAKPKKKTRSSSVEITPDNL